MREQSTQTNARLSQRILCNEARECPCNSPKPFRTLWKIILQKVRVVYMSEELEASRIRVFLKQTQRQRTSGSKLSSESVQNRWRENRDASIYSPTPIVTLITN